MVDPFAGSGVVRDAIRHSGRRSIAVEGRQDYCGSIVRRLSALTLPAV
ncbi:hypothetical protein [Streptomyces aureocirculatus]